MVERLVEDHENAHYLAEMLADLPGIVLDPTTIKTNLIIFGIAPNGVNAHQLADRVKQDGILLQPRGPYTLRAATHYGITRADVETAYNSIRRALHA